LYTITEPPLPVLFKNTLIPVSAVKAVVLTTPYKEVPVW
jgi:hypothetical protein